MWQGSLLVAARDIIELLLHLEDVLRAWIFGILLDEKCTQYLFLQCLFMQGLESLKERSIFATKRVNLSHYILSPNIQLFSVINDSTHYSLAKKSL